MSNKKNILLFGPSLENKNAFYGSGVGGYTRNMAVYLNCFKSEEFTLVPSFHSTRSNSRFHFLYFPFRLIKDIFSFTLSLISYRPIIVHILGQYRTATPREYLICVVAKLFKKKVIYEIKAGVFIEFYNSSNIILRYMINYILNQSELILVEGEIYCDFIHKYYPLKKTFYFPNFLPYYEMPIYPKTIISQQNLKILFTGYCYDGKGVFELVKGLNIAADNDFKIDLTLIGKESPEFEYWLNDFKLVDNFKINRMGVLQHSKVLEIMGKNDVYFYPSRHLGEGHNNSINEAMMMSMIIVSSRIGFIPSVLGENGYFLEKVDIYEIASIIKYIFSHKEEAFEKAIRANHRLIKNFTSITQIPALIDHYRSMSV